MKDEIMVDLLTILTVLYATPKKDIQVQAIAVTQETGLDHLIRDLEKSKCIMTMNIIIETLSDIQTIRDQFSIECRRHRSRDDMENHLADLMSQIAMKRSHESSEPLQHATTTTTLSKQQIKVIQMLIY